MKQQKLWKLRVGLAHRVWMRLLRARAADAAPTDAFAAVCAYPGQDGVSR